MQIKPVGKARDAEGPHVDLWVLERAQVPYVGYGLVVARGFARLDGLVERLQVLRCGVVLLPLLLKITAALLIRHLYYRLWLGSEG